MITGKDKTPEMQYKIDVQKKTQCNKKGKTQKKIMD